MKAASIKGTGKKAYLHVVETRTPEIGPDDVLVEVHASSVNPKDWKLNQQLASLVPNLALFPEPVCFGDDLAGVVVARGKRVTNFEVGEAVFGMAMHPRTAACAEFARIDARCIARKPHQLSFNEAASLPLAGLTALQGLRIGRVEKGSRVLIIGASGGVGTLAVQLAKAMGARVTGVCSGKNAELVRELGADAVIDYTRDKLEDCPDTFDTIFDITSYHSQSSCSKLMATQGYFISTGGNARAIFSSMRDRWLSGSQHSKNVWVDANTRDLETLSAYVEADKLKPVIDSTFNLEDIDAAYQRNRSGHCTGKVVVQIRADS